MNTRALPHRRSCEGRSPSYADSVDRIDRGWIPAGVYPVFITGRGMTGIFTLFFVLSPSFALATTRQEDICARRTCSASVASACPSATVCQTDIAAHVQEVCHIASPMTLCLTPADVTCLGSTSCLAETVPTTPTPSPTTPATTAPAGAEQRPFTPITPELGVPIPGLSISPAIQQNGMVSVPFLSQYIAGAYRYGIRIAIVAAMVMVVYGGFRYLVGAGLGDVKRGKEMILDAVVGLIIVLGAYLILATVSPATLTLPTLELSIVQQEDVDIAQLTTRVPTGQGDTDTGGAYTPSNTSCPVQNLPNGCGSQGVQSCNDMPPGRDQRKVAFRDQLNQHLRATDPHQRILEAAEAAVNCGIHFGSCGETAASIIRSAGLHISSDDRFHSTEMTRLGMQLLCRATTECDHHTPPPPGCTDKQQEAVARVRTFAQSGQDAVANRLQLGDWFQVFNGNPSCGGGHSMIFMGWEGTGPYAHVVQGWWGHLAFRGRVCLKTSCPRGHFSPIYRIKKAREVN